MHRVEARFTLCIDDEGRPSQLIMATSSGIRAYDRTLVEGIRRWRFIPREVGGVYTSSCTTVSIAYTPA